MKFLKLAKKLFPNVDENVQKDAVLARQQLKKQQR